MKTPYIIRIVLLLLCLSTQSSCGVLGHQMNRAGRLLPSLNRLPLLNGRLIKADDKKFRIHADPQEFDSVSVMI